MLSLLGKESGAMIDDDDRYLSLSGDIHIGGPST
jgi:hypothetical protein